jgi:hypothetical protein
MAGLVPAIDCGTGGAEMAGDSANRSIKDPRGSFADSGGNFKDGAWQSTAGVQAIRFKPERKSLDGRRHDHPVASRYYIVIHK